MEEQAILGSADWINAGGLFLIFIGVSLLILEFVFPSFGLFGFAGVTGILIGVIQLHQTGYIDNLPFSIGWLIALAVVGSVLSVIGAYFSYRLYIKKVTTGTEAMVGAPAKVVEWQKKTGKVFIQGEEWQAYSDDILTLAADDDVFISKVDDLKLKIIKPFDT